MYIGDLRIDSIDGVVHSLTGLLGEQQDVTARFCAKLPRYHEDVTATSQRVAAVNGVSCHVARAERTPLLDVYRFIVTGTVRAIGDFIHDLPGERAVHA